MTTISVREHEQTRWNRMSAQTLSRRLQRMSRPDKIRAFIEEAERRDSGRLYLEGIERAREVGVYINDIVAQEILEILRTILADVDRDRLVEALGTYLSWPSSGITMLRELNPRAVAPSNREVVNAQRIGRIGPDLQSHGSVTGRSSRGGPIDPATGTVGRPRTGEPVDMTPMQEDLDIIRQEAQDHLDLESTLNDMEKDAPAGGVQRRIKFRKKRKEDQGRR